MSKYLINTSKYDCYSLRFLFFFYPFQIFLYFPWTRVSVSVSVYFYQSVKPVFRYVSIYSLNPCFCIRFSIFLYFTKTHISLSVSVCFYISLKPQFQYPLIPERFNKIYIEIHLFPFLNGYLIPILYLTDKKGMMDLLTFLFLHKTDGSVEQN